VNPDEEDEEEHTSLDLKNFYGLYIVFAASIGISFVVLFMKLAYLKCVEYSRKRRGEPSDPETTMMNDKGADHSQRRDSAYVTELCNNTPVAMFDAAV
jgi:hypothetical protein